MKTDYDQLQYALFHAAKVGNIKLRREFIDAGADPFAQDAVNCTALDYDHKQNPGDIASLLLELNK